MQNQIPNNWQKVKLKEIAEVKGGKRLPHGFSVQEKKTNHPYLRIVDMNENGISISNVKYISEEVFKKISQYTISNKDLYISIAGTIGYVGKIPQFLSGANLTENCAKICNFSDDIDRDFLLFFLKSYNGRAEIKAGTGGSSQPKLALHRIGNFQLLLPPVGTQKYISSILSSFDNKIELNNKIAKTLEDIASAIFKEFIKDDHSNKILTLRKVADVVKGKKPKNIFIKRIDNSKEYLLIESFTGNKQSYTNDYKVPQGSEYEPVIVMDGASSGKVFVGRDGFVGSTLAVVKTKQEYSDLKLFILFFVKSIEGILTSNFTGSAIPHVDRHLLENYDVPIPGNNEIEKFNKLMTPVIKKQEIIKKESQKLAIMRDLLLPKLMKGEIRV